MFDRNFNKGGDWDRTFKTARRISFIGIVVYLIFAIVIVMFIIHLIFNPEVIGEFFGRISSGFNSVK